VRVEFRVLGPLEAWSDGAILRISSGRQRTVLAALLLHANRVVGVDELAEALWGSAPPPSARVTAQNYVKRLRAALGHAGRRVVTRPPGYLIRVGPDELDISSLEMSLDSARTAAAAGSWESAEAWARAALLLFRGEPLADVPSEHLASREVPRLADMRMQAAEIGFEADLHLGRHAAVIGELRRLVASDPLRERLSTLLMTALYEDGRQAEALAVYQQTRDVLVAELGVEPGHELRDLHQRILAGRQALPSLPSPQPPASAAAGASVAPAPRQLPAAVGSFTGRDAELASLDGLLNRSSSAGTHAVVISAIGGTAGVGKTALAIEWAHRVAGQFPDGQLYVNLRGYDAREPVAPDEALAGVLAALGVPGQQIPADEAGRAAAYRSVLAGRRMLIVLDNAHDPEQVRPLLPGEPGCLVVVTSRDTLAGLVARNGADRLLLDVLPLADALALLRGLIGVRVDAEPDAAARLAHACCRLPLALRVVAELAAARPAASLAGLANELDGQGRLDALQAGGDPASAVRAVFSWSYRHLPADTTRTFRLAALHPGADFDAPAVAALTGTSRSAAARALAELSRASLIHQTGEGRYGMHDLLRAYARDQAAARDTECSCEEALARLLEYYLAASDAAAHILYPTEARRSGAAATAATAPEMTGQAEARAWLDRERASLVAVIVQCAVDGRSRQGADLAANLYRYLIDGSYLPQAFTMYHHVLLGARRSGDPEAEADALNGLGSISLRKGQFNDAAAHYERALERYRQCGNRAGMSRALRNLGLTEQFLHNLKSAADYFRQAMTAYEDAGDDVGAARSLADLGAVEVDLGAHETAYGHLRHALVVLRGANDQMFEARVLERLGYLGLRRGPLAEAADFLEQALVIDRRLANRTGVAAQLTNLAEVRLRQGEYQQAISHLRQARALHREAGYQYGEADTLRALARTLHRAGQAGAARAALTTALELATQTGNTYQLASVHDDLAESHHAAGQGEHAGRHWQQALDLYTQLNAPEADKIRSRLTAWATERAELQKGQGTA
jgi:DNA-binding SARP family transcriptional activator/tetratricopeptide (TPR) repeat protein